MSPPSWLRGMARRRSWCGRTVNFDGLTFAASLAGSCLLDTLVRPRSGAVLRRLPGVWLLSCIATALFGLFLALFGNGAVALALAIVVQLLLVLASNAKQAMLGEPLLFSDFALVGAVFRHPQFYLSAVRFWQRVVIGLAVAALLAMLAWFSVADSRAHGEGVALLAGGIAALVLSLRLGVIRRLALIPDANADTRHLGLLPVLLLYWLRWRDIRDPLPCPAVKRETPEDPPELLVIVQCESFADPEALFVGLAPGLPGLAFARENAQQWGDLAVSGFGAYTMRTEYGVLFGRDEETLGFRRYDPFLTALGEASYALPARLKGWRALFVHPHDMRFYGRDRILPAGGFVELVGENRFAPPVSGDGRYVTDAAMADELLALAQAATGPTMLYAVTIENHGPWSAVGMPHEGGGLMDGYLRLVCNSDAMLTDLLAGIAALKRSAMLVFFGDHRPSIPGVTSPDGDRHTPYVMMRIDAEGGIVPGENRRIDLTPAGLHHAILEAVLGQLVPSPTP